MTDQAPEAEAPSPRRASVIRRLTRRLLRALGGANAEVVEELTAREDRGEELLSKQKDMILNAARFDRLRVADVMRPRADIVALDVSATLGEAARVFSDSQLSRLPIYRETLDDPLGLIHVRDVLSLLAPDDAGVARAKFSDRVLTRIKRDILFVPASMKLQNLFVKMQSSRSHLALVIDEYGGTDGVVTMEDLVEQIVGEIEDEHDDDAALLQIRPGGVDADGRASIETLERALGVSVALPEHEDEFDTVAGLAVALAGRVPQRGEILHHPVGLDIEIADADPRRVKRLRVRKLDSNPTAHIASTDETGAA